MELCSETCDLDLGLQIDFYGGFSPMNSNLHTFFIYFRLSVIMRNSFSSTDWRPGSLKGLTPTSVLEGRKIDDDFRLAEPLEVRPGRRREDVRQPVGGLDIPCIYGMQSMRLSPGGSRWSPLKPEPLRNEFRKNAVQTTPQTHNCFVDSSWRVWWFCCRCLSWLCPKCPLLTRFIRKQGVEIFYFWWSRLLRNSESNMNPRCLCSWE